MEGQREEVVDAKVEAKKIIQVTSKKGLTQDVNKM